MENKYGFEKYEIKDAELKGLTPSRALDIIIRWTMVTQGGVFRWIGSRIGKAPSDNEVVKKVTAVIRMTFREVSEDYDKPTGSSLRKVVERLLKKAEACGAQAELIEYNRKQIGRVLDRL